MNSNTQTMHLHDLPAPSIPNVPTVPSVAKRRARAAVLTPSRLRSASDSKAFLSILSPPFPANISSFLEFLMYPKQAPAQSGIEDINNTFPGWSQPSRLSHESDDSSKLQSFLLVLSFVSCGGGGDDDDEEAMADMQTCKVFVSAFGQGFSWSVRWRAFCTRSNPSHFSQKMIIIDIFCRGTNVQWQ